MAGVLVVDVAPRSAAARAGIGPTKRDSFGRVRIGGVIGAVDGKEIDSSNDLFPVLESAKVGDAVKLSSLRGGKPLQVKATLEALK